MPDSGDQNPYAIVVAPVSAGAIKQGDVLIASFASIPRHMPQCPGGIGLTTAMAMLKSGWVIVGSLPRQDGTTATKGPGCLVVLDSKGNIASTIPGQNINGPRGNMALIGNDTTATLFVSNTGFGVSAPSQDVVNRRMSCASACLSRRASRRP